KLIPQFAGHPLVTGLLDELVAAAADPLALVPSGPADYGTAAVHAYALGKAGRGDEAYGILRQLFQAAPANGIIDWALPWLEAGELANEQRAEAVTFFFVSAHYRFGNRKNLPPDATALAKRWLPHVREVMAGKPYDDLSYTAYIPLLRQTGEM